VGSGGENCCVKHTNFCNVFHIFATNTKVYIFADELRAPSLEIRLRSGDPLKDEAKRLVRKVAEAISFLHSIGVSHNYGRKCDL
jgi:serine/threonine protein kinase